MLYHRAKFLILWFSRTISRIRFLQVLRQRGPLLSAKTPSDPELIDTWGVVGLVPSDR